MWFINIILTGITTILAVSKLAPLPGSLNFFCCVFNLVDFGVDHFMVNTRAINRLPAELAGDMGEVGPTTQTKGASGRHPVIRGNFPLPSIFYPCSLFHNRDIVYFKCGGGELYLTYPCF